MLTLGMATKFDTFAKVFFLFFMLIHLGIFLFFLPLLFSPSWDLLKVSFCLKKQAIFGFVFFLPDLI